MIARLVAWARLGTALFGLFFLLGGLHNTLSPITAKESPLGQLIGIALGALAFAGLALRPASINRILALYWLALVPLGLALASILWAGEPDLAIRRVGGLALTTIFAFWLSERFAPSTLFKLLAGAALALCLMSWFQVFANPQLGIHQATDQSAFQHAGAWRGTFAHKNDFGRAIALAGTIFTVAALAYRRHALFFLLALAQTAVLIAQSSSSQAILLLIVPSAIVALVAATMSMRIEQRTSILVTAIPMTAALYLILDLVVVAILNALGRDASLSGRTDIWATVLSAAQDRIFLGGGFGSGWDAIADRLFVLGKVTAGHAHNGYLDLLVDLGIVGVVTLIVFMLTLGREAIAAVMRIGPHPMALFAVGYVVFYFLGNVAGSFMLQQNSIYWLIPVTAYCVVQRMKYPGLADGPRPERPVSRVPLLSLR